MMRFLKSAILMCSLLMSAVAMLALVSAGRLPAQNGPGKTAGNGDVDCDGTITITDPIRLLEFLFLGGEPPCVLAQEPAGCCPELAQKLDQLIEAVGRLGEPCATRADRFADNGDGTLTDSCTGLVWQKQLVGHDLDLDGLPETSFNYTQALAVIRQSRVGGHDDWRLPTQTEMEGVMRFLAEKPYSFRWMPPFLFHLGEGGGINVWTSTEFNEGLVTVNISPDTMGLGLTGTDNKLRLWLVRNP